MLKGKLVDVRLMRESDLDRYYELYHGSVADRGAFWPSEPRAFSSLPEVRKRFQEDGFWDPQHKFSLLLIADKSDAPVGFVCLRPSLYDSYEIGWIIFEPASRGKGYAAEAAQLLVAYLFDGMKLNRLEAYIHPQNAASRHLAEKCGMKHEATLREFWYQHGRYQDVAVYVILRREHEAALSG